MRAEGPLPHHWRQARSSASRCSLPRDPGDRRARRGAPPRTGQAVAQKPISWDPIPFRFSRKSEMPLRSAATYAASERLADGDPTVIVSHFTDSPDFSSTYNTFAPTRPTASSTADRDVLLTSWVDTQRTDPTSSLAGEMCDPVGLKWTAIGIRKHVG